MEKIVAKKDTLGEKIQRLCFFALSDKLKFSIKVSLSMVLAYLIPFSQGWEQASTAAITIMLIAAMGSLSESIVKGFMRVIGTIIGAIVGMTLIAVFPQDRAFYLMALSVSVAIPLYLVRAYKGDPSIFMLTAMTMMMVFKNGEVDDVFLFGLDKTYMTIFGIMIYTLVGVFLWPVNIEDTTRENALTLSATQENLFLLRNSVKEKRNQTLEKLLADENALENATMDTGSTSINMQQWHSMVYNYKNINARLILLSMHDEEIYVRNFESYVSNYKQLEDEVSSLFKAISLAWDTQSFINIPDTLIPAYDAAQIKDLAHMHRASLISTTQEMKKLHDELGLLAEKLNRIHSPIPTYFESEKIPENRRFIWGDVEHLKGVLVTFIIFWVATFFWITMNPATGFMIVALATGLSVLTTFTPVKPSLLMIIFTLSFVFATFMYVLVLPQLHYAWQLGIFIFVYTFIAFHLINPKIAIFFLLGLFTLNINNTMYYDFSIFLLILLMFYSFLVLLNIFYYIPFSTKSEHLFLKMKDRFFFLSKSILGVHFLASYAEVHLMETVKKMQLWASKIDYDYFDSLDKKHLLGFTKEAEKFAYLLELLYRHEKISKKNPLLRKVRKKYDSLKFLDLLVAYSKDKEVYDFWKEEKDVIAKVEKTLTNILADIDIEKYSIQEIAQLYEYIALRRNVCVALFECQKHMSKVDFNVLKESRF